jgi:hypothetical protein
VNKSLILRDVLKKRSLIRFENCFETGHIDGYVILVGEFDFLVAVVSDQIWLNGFAAFKINSIRKLRSKHPYAKFYEMALNARGEKIPYDAPINGSNIKDWLLEASHNYPLVTVYTEKIDPEISFIGRVVEFTEQEIELLGISPAGQWYAAPDRFKFKDITHIEFGGDYEDALFLVGGEPP